MSVFDPNQNRYNPAMTGSAANGYALGNRIYGGTGSSPNIGPGSVDPAGFQQRDQQAQVKRQMMMKQLPNMGYAQGKGFGR